MKLPFFLPLLLALTGCATGLKQPEFRATRAASRKPHQTVLLFLVDGLAVKTLQTGLRNGKTPNLRRYFLRGGNRFALGEASFPTLTYPNTSSILTGLPVGVQPVISNHVLAQNGKILVYEDSAFFPLLRKTIDPISVIGQLNHEGKETASFSYVLGHNATDHMAVNAFEGIEYEQHQYQSLDERLISSLEDFLRVRGSQKAWPDFLYVHLIGVDGISHRYGPDSPETRDYLAWLDERLGATFRLLEQAEKKPHTDIVSILTADHGFVTTSRYVPMTKFVHRARMGTVILNEGRFLALHVIDKHMPAELAPVLRKARAQRGVALTALRDGDRLEITKGNRSFRFAIGPSACDGGAFALALLPEGSTTMPASFRCPENFDDVASDTPFLVEGLSRYLTAPNHPDALIIADPSVSFTKGMAGSHGGPSAEESFVPVLLRNAELQGSAPVHTSELLKLLLPRSI